MLITSFVAFLIVIDEKFLRLCAHNFFPSFNFSSVPKTGMKALTLEKDRQSFERILSYSKLSSSAQDLSLFLDEKSFVYSPGS